jgi:hypothetical protein
VVDGAAVVGAGDGVGVDAGTTPDAQMNGRRVPEQGTVFHEPSRCTITQPDAPDAGPVDDQLATLAVPVVSGVMPSNQAS